MAGREELEAALRGQAAVDVPGPDAAFADALEQRLLAGPTPNVVPLARRARAISATAIVTATVVFAGAAAAAGVVVARPFDDDRAPTPTTISTTTTSAEPTTTAATVETTVPVTEPPTAPPATAPSSTPQTTAAPATVPPATAPPTTAPPTTEVRLPATISLTCVPDAGTVRCTWAGTAAVTVWFAVIRAQPGTGRGGVLWVPAGTTTWLDPIATSGTTIGYVVHAMDGAGNSLGHSTLVTVACC